MTEKDNKKKREKAKPERDKSKAVRRTSIGGQAVLEGVMMKGTHSMATAVRSPDGSITVESKYIKSAKEKNVFFRLPFVRGVVNLVTQLFQGTGIIMRSAEVYGDFAEPSKFDKWISKKFKINPMNVLMGFSVVLGILIAVGLFVFLPNFLAGLIRDNVAAIANSELVSLWYSLIEGGIMLTIFICYILLVTLMKDVRRVFMYHGAEHKVISCYEHGLDLTVENAKKMKREHSRCGTTFLFFVVAVSIMVFVLINFMLDKCGLLVESKVANVFIRLGFKLLFLPVVAGISYEILKLLAKSDCLFVRILRAPGMALQKLTTKEPTDDMLEVSLTAFKTVMAMDADPTIPERTFDIKVPYAVARDKIAATAKNADESDIDWILVAVTEVKRSELETLSMLSKAQFDSAMSIAERMKDGKPLQYAMGSCDFYGYTVSVNQNTLIPRPETEELAEKAIIEIKARIKSLSENKGEKSDNSAQNGEDEMALKSAEAESENGKEKDAKNDGNVNVEKCAKSVKSAVNAQKLRVLDLCTGSGAIAVAINKETGAEVVASDISAGAAEVAKMNALNLGADVKVVVGDMFEACEGAFDVIVCNPPYIPSADIAGLEEKVKNFEPLFALDGGADGLKFYRIIAKELSKKLKDGGVMFLEFGMGQAESIKEIFADCKVEIFKDLQGVDRMARIEKKL